MEPGDGDGDRPKPKLDRMSTQMRSRLEKGSQNIWTDHNKLTASPASFRVTGSRPSSAPSKRSTVASQAPQRARVALQAPLGRSLSPWRTQKPGKWKPLAHEFEQLDVPNLLDLLTPAIVWSHPKKRRPHASGAHSHRHSHSGREPRTHRESHYCNKEFLNGQIDDETEVHGVYEGTYWDLLADLKAMKGFLAEHAKEPEMMEVGEFTPPERGEMPVFKSPAMRPDPPQPERYVVKQKEFKAPPKLERPQFDKSKVQMVEVPAIISATLETYPKFEVPTEPDLAEFQCPEWEEFAPPPPKLPEGPAPPDERAVEPTQPADLPAPTKGTFAALPVASGMWKPPPEPAGLNRHIPTDGPEADLEPLPEYVPPEPRPRFVFDWSLLDRGDLLGAGGGTGATCEKCGKSGHVAANCPAHPCGKCGEKGHVAEDCPHCACAKCGEEGHVAANCPAAPCGNCGKEGHVKADCPHPKVPRLDLSGRGGGGGWGGGMIATGPTHLNFEAPYEDPPPLVPPRDQMDMVQTARPGPEPSYKTPRRESMPAMKPFVPERDPIYIPPLKRPLPEWVEPSAPRPMGFIRGLRPVLVLDVSGTMADRLPDEDQCRQEDLKECIMSLLAYDPPSVGQLATTCLRFDLIAYSWRAWSWASELEERARIKIRDATPIIGRQAGGRLAGRPASAPALRGGLRPDGRGCCTPTMMPTEPMWLDLAAAWVARWQKAQGKTNCLDGLKKALDQPDADSIYLFSDGLADNRYAIINLLEGLKSLEKASGTSVPPIHTVAIQAPVTGDRFLRQVAEITGGSYMEFQPARKDRRGEAPLTAEQRVEREWAEAQVALALRENHKKGVVQTIDEIIEGVRRRHEAERVEPARLAQAKELEDAKMLHQEACMQAARRNAAREKEHRRHFDHDVARWREREAEAVKRAKQDHDLAMQQWMAKMMESEAEAEGKRAMLKVAREELLASVKHDPRLLQELAGRNSRSLERHRSGHKRAVADTQRRNEEVLSAAAAQKEAIMRRRAKQEALEAHHNAEVVHSLVHHCIYKVAAPAAENEARALAVHRKFEEDVTSWTLANSKQREAYKVAFNNYEQLRVQWVKYRQKKAMHTAEVAALESEYERAVADAKARHAPIRAAALVAYEKAAEEREMRLYKRREEAEREYKARVGEVDERNRLAKLEAERRRRERAAAEDENRRRMVSAKAKWRWLIAKTLYRNMALKSAARREYMLQMAIAAASAEREHEEHMAAWEGEVRRVRQSNEASVKAEVAAHRAEVARLEGEYEDALAEARAEWEEKTREAEAQRLAVLPQVELARKVGGELDKVERFLRRIRENAGECWDRVVEMSTIVLALDEAFLGEEIPWDLSLWPNIPPSAMQALRDRLAREEAESVRRLSPPRSRATSPPARMSQGTPGGWSARGGTPGGWSARTTGDIGGPRASTPGGAGVGLYRPTSAGPGARGPAASARPKSARPRLEHPPAWAGKEAVWEDPEPASPSPVGLGLSTAPPPSPSAWAWGSPRDGGGSAATAGRKRPSSAKKPVVVPSSGARTVLKTRPARERLQMHHMLPPHMIRVRPVLNQVGDYRAS